MTGEPGVNDTATDVEVDHIPATPVDVPGTFRTTDISSTPAIPGTSSAVLSTPHPTDRLSSLGRKRTRTRSVVLKPEH